LCVGRWIVARRDNAAGRERHFVWAITWLDGRPLATAVRRSPELWRDLGQEIGGSTPRWRTSTIRRFIAISTGIWQRTLDRRIEPTLAPRPVVAPALDRLIGQFDERTAPLLADLPRAAIHNDLNDHNVLVGADDDVERSGQRIAGIVDFGDMVHSYRVGNVAIAIAYAVLGARDPLTVAASIVRGYSSAVTLSNIELEALYGLIALRLCASACIAVEQTRLRPDNAYLAVSQASIRDTLPLLADIPFKLAEAVLRDAAGVCAVPASERVIAFLERATIALVLGVELRREPTIVLDLSVDSPIIGGDERDNAEPALTSRVFGAMSDAGVTVAVGRYNEPRLLYVAPEFALGPRLTDEHRTIHIGLDLFAEAGTPVFAPLPGVVHAFADNRSAQDYGPVIVLRHATDDGGEFFTLYGHLSRESLAGSPLAARWTPANRSRRSAAPT
jgi:Ser/Thr protein kinase RdoA (MazF antagonist)